MKTNRFITNSVFISASLLLAYFFSDNLTGYTLLMTIIIGITLWPRLIDREYDKGQLHWGSALIAATLVSLLLFERLTSPSADTFTNAHHHVVSVDGFITDGKVSLVAPKDENAVWQLEGDCGYLTLENRTDSFLLSCENFTQPVYRSTEYDSLLNGKSLPYFSNALSIAFNDGYRLQLEFKQKEGSGKGQRDTAEINIKLTVGDSIVDNVKSDFTRPIRKSLPLATLVGNMKTPISFTKDLNLLEHIGVLREVTGKKDQDYRDSGFFVALNKEALQRITEICCDHSLLPEYPWNGTFSYAIKPDEYIKAGTGIYATDGLSPQLLDDKRTFLDFKNKPTHYLMSDSTGTPHELLLTTDKQALAKSKVGMGLFYNLFRQPENQNHFISTITYIPGGTHELLGCKIQSMTGNEVTAMDGKIVRGILPGDSFILSGGGKLSTKLTYHNLYEESPIKPIKCAFLIVLTCLFGYISLSLSSRFELKAGIECASWILLQLLLIYRMFLAWRISVFLPVEDIGTSATNILRNGGDVIVHTFGALAAFFIIIILWKTSMNRWKHYGSGMTGIEMINGFIASHPFYFLIVLLLCYAILGFALGHTFPDLTRISNIFFPVAICFLSEWILFRSQEEEDSSAFKTGLLRICNFCFCIGLLFLNDPGYGIMFFLFSLLYLSTYCFLVCQIQTYVHNRNIKYSLFICPLVLFLAFILGGTRTAAFIFTYPQPVFLFVGGCLIGLLCYLYHTERIWGNPFNWEWLKEHWFTSFLLISVVAIYITGLFTIGSYFHENPHFRYRAEIHNKSVSDIMLNEEVDTRNYERLLEAAQNQWYLNYQEKKGEEIRFVTDSPYRLLPHFNKGISWITQTSDAVLSRYVIGEHSDITPIALMAVMLIFAFGLLTNYRLLTPSVMVLAGCGMLLACQSMFIWMATTNRFIFFGQDFPMLSVTSKVTVLYTLFLLGLIILCSTKAEESAYSSGSRPIHYHRSVYIGFPILLLALFGWIANDIYLPKSNYNRFNIRVAIEHSRKELSMINDKLEKFQKRHLQKLVQDKILEEENTVFSPRPRAHQTNYYAFINQFNQSPTSEDSNISIMEWVQSLANTGEISPFTSSLYKLYVNKLSKRNSPEDIIHLRQPDGNTYQLAISNSFFMLSAPMEMKYEQKGNIIASKDKEEKETAITLYKNGQLKQEDVRSKVLTLNHQNGLTMLDDFSDQFKKAMVYFCKLDESWTPEGEVYYIVGKKRKDDTSIQLLSGSNKYLINDIDKELSTLTAYAGDYIHLPSSKQYIYINGESQHFFMKNIWVNGTQDAYYPLGESFFYPYHLSEAMQKGKGDLELTLNYELTQELYYILGKINDGAFSRNIIAANGKGEVKAMVSHKFKQGYPIALNPNDKKTVRSYAEDFYLKSNPRKEKRIWGEINLMLLPKGPGSTIKPIYFSAVSSQLPIDWSKFRMIIDDHSRLVHNGSSCFITHYSDRTFKKPVFQSIGKDEQSWNVSEFITMSSNYFNSMLVHLGNYQSEQLADAFHSLGKSDNPLFTERTEQNSFPAFSFGGPKYVFKHWLGYDGQSSHDGGILSKALELNFSLPAVKERRLSNIYFMSLNPYENENKISYTRDQIAGIYAFPEASRYDQEYFASDYAVNQENILFAASLAGANVVSVTPWKMLEMYGKLASRNRNYKLVLSTKHIPQYDSFIYKGKDDQSVYTDLLFEGMHNAALKGTAKRLAPLAKQLEQKGYYLYCKTGTNSQGKDAPSNTQNQYLGVIISKGKLAEVNAENKGKQKFFVLYFYTENHPHNYANIQECIEVVVQSASFINYMK